MTPALIRFAGSVTCHAGECGPLGLRLAGRALEDGLPVQLAFAGPVAAELPAALENVSVQQLQPRGYRITADSGEWLLEAASVHLHRDVSAAFHAAVPPRVVSARKRLFWNAVLLLAATPLGPYLLQRRRAAAADFQT